MYCTRLTENTGSTKSTKFAICTQSHDFVGLYLRNKCIYRQSEKIYQMSSQYGEIRPTNGSDRFTSLGHPANFNRFRFLALLLQRRRSPETNQTLHDLWSSPGLVHYIYILAAFASWQNFAACKIHLRPSLAFSYIGRVTAWHFSRGSQPNFAAWYSLYSAGRPSRWASAHILVGNFLRPVFTASPLQHVSDVHPKFALRPHHVWKCGIHPICNGWD